MMPHAVGEGQMVCLWTVDIEVNDHVVRSEAYDSCNHAVLLHSMTIDIDN
jgi:hypothetical protein